jgi:hypothetical protein
MKFLLLFLISSRAIAYEKHSAYDIFTALNIPVKENGQCFYSKRRLNRTQINRKFSDIVNYQRGVLPDSIELKGHFECQALTQNLNRDSEYCGVHPDDVFNRLPFIGEPQYKIRGKIRYLGFVNKAYRYDINIVDAIMRINIKIHFKKHKKVSAQRHAFLVQKMNKTLKSAAKTWTLLTPDNIAFDFEVTEPNDSHFQVILEDGPTRGPYDTRWNAFWSVATVTHEMGHMLGLDDEYDNIQISLFRSLLLWTKKYDPRFREIEPWRVRSFVNTKLSRCDRNSFMCSSRTFEMRPYHVYQVLKRVFCQ